MTPTRRGAALPLVLALLVPALVACSGDDPEAPSSSASASAEVVRLAGRALDRRATALLDGDRDAFVAGLDGSDPAFLSRQQTYFDNLQALPVGSLSYRVDPGGAVRDGRAWWLVVDVRLRLEGYDAAPVITPDRIRVVPRRGGERYVVASVGDAAWEQRMGVRPEPWDGGPIEVDERPGVLGVFDAGSVAAAPDLMDSLDGARDDVDAVVPDAGDGSDDLGVVVYALSSRDVIDRVEGGVDPGHLDGVTYAVRARPGASRTVGYRVALDPSVLRRPGAGRDRLLRHELTHVALGDRARGAPLWVSEGLAEWVSVQPYDSTRELPTSTLDAARAGVTAMPDDAAFTDDGAERWYGVVWFAMEVLAGPEGSDGPDAAVLWEVLDDVRGDVADQDAALQALTGLDTATLARRAADLVLQRYA